MKQNVELRPSPSDSTQIRPPWTSTMRLTRASPTPVPTTAGSRRSKSPKILDEEDRLRSVAPPADLDPWRLVSASVLDRVLDQVLVDLDQPSTVAPDRWQIAWPS